MAPALIAPDLTGLDASATLVRPPRLNRGTPAAAPKCPPTAELRDTLSGSPPTLSPKYFYDAIGCALYEQICKQPAYYPPRVERTILDRHLTDILAALPRNVELAGIVGSYIGLDIA